MLRNSTDNSNEAMADRPRYDVAQLEKYFDRISFPAQSRIFDITGRVPEAQLQLLLELQTHQLVRIPFENLTLHYSWHRTVDICVNHLYDKIVGERRGGYCMENNSFFHTVLLSLGYDVYMAGARVYNPASYRYGGLSHCLNIVTIGGVRYAVDVGFGSRCPVRPLNMTRENSEHYSDLGHMRLRYDHIQQALCRDQRVWIYEYRLQSTGDWVPQYCFMDAEFLPEDIRVLNWSPSKSPSSFFTYKVICVKFTTKNIYLINDPDQDSKIIQEKETHDAIDGVLIIDGNTLKWRWKDRAVWGREFKSENERLEALQKYFGIILTDENTRAIRGTVGAIIPDAVRAGEEPDDAPANSE